MTTANATSSWTNGTGTIGIAPFSNPGPPHCLPITPRRPGEEQIQLQSEVNFVSTSDLDSAMSYASDCDFSIHWKRMGPL